MQPIGDQDGCVFFGAFIDKGGYGRLTPERRNETLLAHRHAWEQVHGLIPEGLQVHHECGNRACVNVEHLRLLTPRAHAALNRQCEHADRYVRPDGRSECRICNRERRRERYRFDPEFRARTLTNRARYRARKKVAR